MSDINNLLQRLCDADIDFVVVGGFAAMLHGSSLLTRSRARRPPQFHFGVGEFESVRAHAVEVELFGRRCRVISLDDLIRAKEALGRDKDVQAVLQLRAIREKLKASSPS